MIDQAEKLRLRMNQISESVQVQEESKDEPAGEGFKSARVIAVTSGKGGVGKSSLSVNLALQLQKAGKKTVIIDTDFGLANIEVMLGIRPHSNMADLLFHDKKIEDIITKGPLEIGFISGGSGVQELSTLSREEIQEFSSKLSLLDDMTDVIIIDTGAGISDAVLEFLLCAPEILLVITPEPTSITDAYSLLKTLNRNPGFDMKDKRISIVINRVTYKNQGLEIFNKISMVATNFLKMRLEYFGEITYDEKVSRAIIAQKPVTLTYPSSRAAKDIELLAGKLLNDDSIQKNKGGFARFFTDFLKNNKHR